jgi:hypothetical protein
MVVMWAATPCSLKTAKSFGGAYHLQFPGQQLSKQKNCRSRQPSWLSVSAVPCFVYSTMQKMEVICYSEMSGCLLTVQHYI